VRHRSKTNSRPWEDLEFRRRYMSEKPFCELTPWLRANIPAFRKSLYPQEAATDPHHIFGGTAMRRWDLASNLLAVSRTVHIWAHAKDCNIDARILGVWRKMKDGLFDADEFRKVTGKFAAGWISLNRPQSEPFVPLWEELVAYSERE
jgi:hypothetical protein